MSRSQAILLVAAALVVALVATEASSPRQLSAGIVVPKRSALISGLNQQFRLKKTTTSGSNGSSQVTSRRQQPQTLYLDRQQQQLLAANPNLLNPERVLDSRSEEPTVAMRQTIAMGQPATSIQSGSVQNASLASISSTTEQQSYRGYSLIELEVKSESERRYIQDLYGNLSAALDEQARNPQALTVSPYVDVDFWSFKSAINDQIDIMVSPKSRSFLLNQLSRAKIKHRVKIDDVQARLDQQVQQQPTGQLAPASGHSQLPLPAAEQLPNGLLSGRQQLSGSTSNQSNEANLRARQAESGKRPALNDSQFFDNYQRLADINEYVEALVQRNRDVARVKVIGRSSQGRYLRVLKLGYDQQDADGATSRVAATAEAAGNLQQAQNASSILNSFLRRQESVQKLGSIWLDGGTHAREWISPATVLYIAFRLTDNHNRCGAFFDLLRLQVGQATSESQLSARSFISPPAANLDVDLITGINEINTSLLGKPVKTIRPRSQLEQTLELLAKKPQEAASEHGCDLELEQLLRRYTFYIMPVLNPDGYEYSHTHNRLWRKTRSTSSHPIYRHFCLGADPNRNYDARHGATGSSTHPCSQTYAGATPFTEPETRHQSNFVYAHRAGMKMFISFHSYSQMILLPFSHSKQLAPDHKDLESVGQAAVKAIERTHGTVYRVGPSASILYTASGTASDWAYEKAGVKYSYTIELRDTGAFGFLLPRQQIVPTGEETFNGLLAMIAQMEKNDNLLTSKSIATGSRNASSAAADMDYVHVPQEDQLRPFHLRDRQRPALENALGVNRWEENSLEGVRDRKPVRNELHSVEADGAVDLADLNSGHRLEEEPIGTSDTEPDSGYAFEGEGELMEPTRENIAEASRMSDARLAGRQDHSRRIVQSTGLTASGRSVINSPLQSSRLAAGQPKRESSSEAQSDSTPAL